MKHFSEVTPENQSNRRYYMSIDVRPYTLGFTTGGLFLYESIAVAEAWVKEPDWNAVRKAVAGNLFISTGKSLSTSRLRNEVISRLKTLSPEELQYLADCPIPDAKALCWLAACRKYRLVTDFAWEVLFEKYSPYAEPVRHSDFYTILDGIEANGERPQPVTTSTRLKLASVLFRMLSEAELIDKEGNVLTLLITEDLRELVAGRSFGGLDCIPGGR